MNLSPQYLPRVLIIMGNITFMKTNISTVTLTLNKLNEILRKKIFMTKSTTESHLGPIDSIANDESQINLDDKSLAILAASQGKVELLQNIKNLPNYIDDIIFVATISGKINILKYIDKILGYAIHSAISSAAAYGHLNIIEYLHSQKYNISEALLPALLNNQIEIVKFLLIHEKDRIDSDQILNYAIIHEQVDMLQLLHSLQHNLITAIPLATSLGKAKILKYMHENGLMPSSFSKSGLLRLKEMQEEIKKSDPIYYPSQFWQMLGSTQEAHLNYSGEHNFKRTLNLSYCNFIPTTAEDGLIDHLASSTGFLKEQHRYSILDPDNNSNLWFSFYPDYHVFKGERALKMKLYLQFIGQMYEYILGTPEGKILEQLEEPKLGNPIQLFRNGKLIAQDLATSVMERKTILKGLEFDPERETPYCFAELGAGYGRLAYVLQKTLNCRTMIFDIPPALYLSEWYLSSTLSNKKVFKFRHFDSFQEIEKELEEADIAFFTPNQLEKFPNEYFDAFISISSLHEMTRQQIAHFMNLMQQKTHSLLYIKQYWKYINPHDNLCITDQEYTLTENFRLLEKTQDPLNPLFFEMTAQNIRKPTISILLCNYNHAQYLPESLGAICAQTVLPTEIIIIDDGSTDNSLEIIKGFQEKFPQIKLFQHEQNMGLMISINRILHEATGEYIVWAAADDKLLPNFIEMNMKMLKKIPNIKMLFSQLGVFIDPTYEIRDYTTGKYGPAFNLGNKPHFLTPALLLNRLRENYLWMSGNTVVVNRLLIIESGGFNKHLRWHCEWFLYYAIALRKGACVIPETLALIRERKNTYSSLGMHNSLAQHQVLKMLASTLFEPQNKDLYDIFLKRPCLFSPFGSKMIWALASRPRFWQLLVNYLFWYIFKHHKYHLWGLRRIRNYFAWLVFKIKPILIKICPKPIYHFYKMLKHPQ